MIGRRSTPHLWAAVAATLRGYRLRMVVAAACLLGAIAADLLLRGRSRSSSISCCSTNLLRGGSPPPLPSWITSP